MAKMAILASFSKAIVRHPGKNAISGLILSVKKQLRSCRPNVYLWTVDHFKINFFYAKHGLGKQVVVEKKNKILNGGENAFFTFFKGYRKEPWSTITNFCEKANEITSYHTITCIHDFYYTEINSIQYAARNTN